MKSISIFILISLFTASCHQKRVQLPQVSEAHKTHLTDHSPIYIFFDEETKQAKLNRSNLITSTHWIFHVDKRNSLYQSALQIDKMQTKKENPMSPHSNPSSRNYFSVAEMTQKQLGFIDFTPTRFRFFQEENEPKTASSVQVFARKDGFYIGEEKISLSEFSQNTNKSYLWVFDGAMSFEDFVHLYQSLLNADVVPSEIFYTKP